MAGEPEDFILDLRFRKCTFFLVRKKKRGGGREPARYAGTAFAVSVGLVGHEIDKSDWAGGIDYAVTAGHVVKNTPADEELYIRVNKVGLKTHDIKVPVGNWKFHPNTDVAACAVEWSDGVELDVMTIPITKLPQGPEGVYANQVVEGEEVISVGLLTPFPGSDKIQPIVRTGKIALMPYEKMKLEMDRKTTEFVDAYLIEMIAWAGSSGSPVVVYPHRNPANRRNFDFFLPYLVLGLIHGTLETSKEVHFSRDVRTIRLGSGIAVVIPGESIREVLMNNGDLRIQRAELLEEITRQKGAIATPTSNEDAAPFTQSDFEQALRKASRRIQTSQSDEEKK